MTSGRGGEPLCVYPAGGELSLAVCVAVSNVLNESGTALRAQGLSSVLKQLSSTVETQLEEMRAEHQAGMDAQPYIDRLCEALTAIASTWPQRREYGFARGVVGQVCAAVARCAGTVSRPVDSCCQFAFAVAEGAYGGHLDSRLPALRFEIEPAEADLSWHGVGSKVAGSTTLQGRPAATSVGLTLSLKLPWRDALSAIPYVLMHECVAHAFRGPEDSTKDTDQGSEFAEGWMDRVALLLLLRTVRSTASLLPWPWSLVADLDARVTVVSNDRLSERDPDPQERRRARWGVGHRAALEVERTIKRIQGCDQAEATDTLIRLSLLLNASGMSPGDRDRLAMRIYLATDPPSPESQEALERNVRDWLSSGLPPRALLRRP